MSFINEEILKEQYKAYNLKAIDARWRLGIPVMDWTIDKERDIWLRLCYKRIEDEEEGQIGTTWWNFYWKGALFTVFTKQMSAPEQKGEIENYAYMKILDIYIGERYQQGNVNKLFPVEFPKEFAPQKNQILKDFKEAMEVSNIGLGLAWSGERYTVDLLYEDKAV
ncbi:MAG: hypothetical protein LBB59_07915 [Campylobacteraceae bacterium]|nr:hypothetical protein [Campylobacteraceae bacterium]